MKIELFLKGAWYTLANFSEIPRVGDTMLIDKEKYTIKEVQWVSESKEANVKRLIKINVYAE